jgi:hypothetical protein
MTPYFPLSTTTPLPQHTLSHTPARLTTMASSLASTSRMGAALLSSSYTSIEGTVRVAATSKRRRSAVAAGKQREVRLFSTSTPRKSVWATGHNVDGSGKDATSTSSRRFSLPPSEKYVTVGRIAELKSRGEPM